MKPHGLRGELAMKVYTDFPERLEPGTLLYIGDAYEPKAIQSVRWNKDTLLVRFEGITDRDQAEGLRSQWVLVRSDDRPLLPPGEYYHHQLIGLDVVDQSGSGIGKVGEILSTGANDVLVIAGKDGEELLIPATEEVLIEIDLDGGRLVVNLIPGLLPD
jgi:16S rRNA processing protein RimM